MKLFIAASAHHGDKMVVDFINATNDILRYAQAVAKAPVPDMMNAPQWYLDFQANWINVLAHANEWVHKLGSNMQETLADFSDDKDLIIDDLTKCLTFVDELIVDPNQPEVKQALANTLAKVVSTEKTTPTTVQAFRDNLARFTDNITADATVISSGALNAINQAGADTSQCTDLGNQIADLKAEIDKYNTIITTTSQLQTPGIAVAVVGMFMAAGGLGLAGGFTIGIGVAMIGTAVITKIVLDAKIKGDQVSILEKQSQITDLQNRALAMKSLSDTLNALVTLNSNAQSAAAKIAAAWKQLSDDLNAFMTSLNAATTAEDYQAERTDLQAALEEWNTLQALVGSISVQVTISDQPIYLNQAA